MPFLDTVDGDALSMFAGSKMTLQHGDIGIRSPLARVRVLLSSRTEFRFSIQMASTGPSRTSQMCSPGTAGLVGVGGGPGFEVWLRFVYFYWFIYFIYWLIYFLTRLCFVFGIFLKFWYIGGLLVLKWRICFLLKDLFGLVGVIEIKGYLCQFPFGGFLSLNL